MATIFLNGKKTSLEEKVTVTDLVASLRVPQSGFAVAVNSEVLPRAFHADRTLRDGDRVEIIQAVAGG